MLNSTVYCFIYPRIYLSTFLVVHFFLWTRVTFWSCFFFTPKELFLFPVRHICWQQILSVITYLGLFSFCLYFWRMGLFVWTGYRIFVLFITTTAVTVFHCPLTSIISDEKSVINFLSFLIILKTLSWSLVNYELSTCRTLVSILLGSFWVLYIIFHQIWKALSRCFFKYFFLPLSLLFSWYSH